MRKTKLKNTDGFTMHGWMVTELQLEVGDLIAFALVHQFSQSNAGLYKGNTAYLSAWTGWSERTSRAHLLALQKRGLIAEVRGRKNNSPYCYYKLGPAFSTTQQKLQGDGAIIAPTTPQKFQKAHRNAGGEINNNESTSGFMPPTPSEVAEYCRSRCWTDPDGFATHYCAKQAKRKWCRSTGEKIDNWKLNVNSWERYHKTKTFSTPSAPASSAKPVRQMTEAEYQAFCKE